MTPKTIIGAHMLSPRPLYLAARLGLALGASLTLGFASLPGSAAAAPSTSTSSAASRPGYIDPTVLEKTTSNPSSTVRVIITRSRAGDPDKAVHEHGGRVVGRLHLANATVAEVPADQVSALARQPGVARVSFDAPVQLQAVDPLSTCCSQLQTVYPYAVDAVSQWNSARQLRGTGVGVAVIDSGIQPTVTDFLGGGLAPGSRILQLLNGIAASNFSGADDSGHGTFVAGIIGGRGWGAPGVVTAGSYVGIAPDANLISIKVSDSTGMAHVSDVIGAIEWVAQHRTLYNIRVLNLSLASSVADSYLGNMLDAAVELAWLQGIVVVVAAGNAGPNAPISAPANDPFVITVGATDDQGTISTADDVLAPFSSYGTTVDRVVKPDLVAPGRHIVSTLSSPTAPLATRFPANLVGNGNYIRLSGTSAAAPVVSGVVAQLLQARPSLNPGQVKWLLTHTAQSVAGVGTGAGYPRVGAAVNYGSFIGTTNFRLPNLYLLAAYAAQQGRAMSTVSWDAVSWDAVSWDAVSWDAVSWDAVSWDAVSWDNVSWDAVSWDNVVWLPTD